MPTRKTLSAPALPTAPRGIRIGAWVEVLKDYRSTASFGELPPEEEPDARLYGRVASYDTTGGRVSTVYVEVRAAASCSYGHWSDDRRPLEYEPGHAGLTADLPRRAVKLVTDQRTLAWLMILTGDGPWAKALRELEADVSEDYYRGSQLMLKVKHFSGDYFAVQLIGAGGRSPVTGVSSVSVARWDDRRYVDLWSTVEATALEEEPEGVDEVEFERWENVSGVVGEYGPELLDGLAILWSIA